MCISQMFADTHSLWITLDFSYVCTDIPAHGQHLGVACRGMTPVGWGPYDKRDGDGHHHKNQAEPCAGHCDCMWLCSSLSVEQYLRRELVQIGTYIGPIPNTQTHPPFPMGLQLVVEDCSTISLAERRRKKP